MIELPILSLALSLYIYKQRSDYLRVWEGMYDPMGIRELALIYLIFLRIRDINTHATIRQRQLPQEI
jgi:hypothetical protein